MTLKEMFKKLEGYNEISEAMGYKKAYIVFIEGVIGETFRGETLAEIRSKMRQHFINPYVDAILGYDGYEFGKEQEIKYSCYGKDFTETVLVTIDDDWRLI